MTGWRIGWLTGPESMIGAAGQPQPRHHLRPDRFRLAGGRRGAGKRLRRHGDRRALRRSPQGLPRRGARPEQRHRARLRRRHVCHARHQRDRAGRREIRLGAFSMPRSVAVMPGSSFGDAAAGHIRISLCQPDDMLLEAATAAAPLRFQLSQQGSVTHGRPPLQGPRGHHRRRRLRLLGRLSSGQARLDRHRASGAQAAHLRHDLARGRADRPVARLAEHDAAREIFGRPLRQARGRDRRRHRHAPGRLDHGRADRGAQARDLSPGLARPRLRRRRARDFAGRGQGDVSASQHRRRGRRGAPAARRPVRPGQHRHGAGQGRAAARREDLRGRQGHGRPPEGRPRHRRLLGARDGARHDRDRHRRQLRRHVGARARRACPASRSRCMPASISISSPSRSPASAACRCCACRTNAPTTRRTPAR